MFFSIFSKFSSEIKSCEFYLQHINIVKICCLHHEQHSTTIQQHFINFNRHIEDHVKFKKIPKIPANFFSGGFLFVPLFQKLINFFAILTNDLRVLRNKICYTLDNFFTYKIFHFDLPPNFGKKKCKFSQIPLLRNNFSTNVVQNFFANFLSIFLHPKFF